MQLLAPFLAMHCGDCIPFAKGPLERVAVQCFYFFAPGTYQVVRCGMAAIVPREHRLQHEHLKHSS